MFPFVCSRSEEPWGPVTFLSESCPALPSETRGGCPESAAKMSNPS